MGFVERYDMAGRLLGLDKGAGAIQRCIEREELPSDIADALDVADERIRNIGGRLHSRQAIAAIICAVELARKT